MDNRETQRPEDHQTCQRTHGYHRNRFWTCKRLKTCRASTAGWKSSGQRSTQYAYFEYLVGFVSCGTTQNELQYHPPQARRFNHHRVLRQAHRPAHTQRTKQRGGNGQGLFIDDGEKSCCPRIQQPLEHTKPQSPLKIGATADTEPAVSKAPTIEIAELLYACEQYGADNSEHQCHNELNLRNPRCILWPTERRK